MSRNSVYIPSGIRRLAAAAGLAVFFVGTGYGLANAGAFDAILGPGLNIPPSAANEPLTTPTEYRSDNGKLQVTMEARATQVQLGAYQVNGATYNGSYGGARETVGSQKGLYTGIFGSPTPSIFAASA